MGARSTGREAALQMLFAVEAGGSSAPRVVATFWRETPGDPEGRAYADEVVHGVATVSYTHLTLPTILRV